MRSLPNSAWENRDLVQEILHAYFPDPQISLNHKDPYTLLIAVLLSAQCSDKKVNELTPALFALAETPQKMVRLPLPTLEKVLRPLGLFRTKAKAILALSQQLLDHFSGVLPQNPAALETLPGVGHKTAAVVLGQAFGIPAFPVDTHIFRSAHRWGLSRGKTPAQVEADLKELFPISSWNKLHLQIIYFARAHCPARNHKPALCPLCSKLTQ